MGLKRLRGIPIECQYSPYPLFESLLLLVLVLSDTKSDAKKGIGASGAASSHTPNVGARGGPPIRVHRPISAAAAAATAATAARWKEGGVQKMSTSATESNLELKLLPKLSALLFAKWLFLLLSILVFARAQCAQRCLPFLHAFLPCSCCFTLLCALTHLNVRNHYWC